MSLWKRDGMYYAYFYVAGVRVRKSTGTSNRRQAEQIAQQLKQQANLKRHQVPQLAPEMSFEELTTKFLASAAAKPYHRDRLKLLLPFFSSTAIGQINKNSTREYRQKRHETKKLTNTTVNRDIEVLRHILFWAVDEGFLMANPLSRMRLERERKRKRPVMSVEEELLLLPAASPHLRLIIIAALDSGMRRGEILNQRWEDMDFSRELLFVSRSKTPEGESREIPLTKRLRDLLWKERKESGLVFTFKGKSISRIKTAWKAALRRGCIRHYRFHDLRHTFNTRLMECGVMQEVRKALMGHSSGEDVHATYTHVELPVKKAAIRKLESWLRKQTLKVSQNKKTAKEVDGTDPVQTTDRGFDAGSAA